MNEKTMNNQIQNLLTEVSQIIKTHEQHANKQGEKFNIFTILKVDRKEVETHSRFIYELLNPNGSHGQGDIFLQGFAKIVLNSEVAHTAIEPQREDSTTQNRRIDFTLETEQNIIGIEMKIDAGDQNHQLWDYQQELKGRAEKKWKNKNKTKLFYLSLEGKEASEYSYKKNDEVVKYECISFAAEILKWINDCIKQSAEKSVLREALIQYKILIEKLTGQNQDMNTEIVEQITKNTDNFKTALQIEKALVLAKTNFQIKFWDDLLGKLGKGFSFGNQDEDKEKSIKDACKAYYQTSKNNIRYGIIYNININSRLMLIVDNYDGVYFCINNEENQLEYELTKDSEGWFYTKSAKGLLDFREFDEKLVDTLSEKKPKIIEDLAKEFKELVNKLEK